MLNSKRCFKASTQIVKIEALKLVGEVKGKWQNFARATHRKVQGLVEFIRHGSH
ncbi:hypothetical protein HMPREF9554_01639 [Treponema phagedenis F0421]|nr:hypothetical protein HMPREF9554_01639 [Treponema phagedenis F0421]